VIGLKERVSSVCAWYLSSYAASLLLSLGLLFNIVFTIFVYYLFSIPDFFFYLFIIGLNVHSSSSFSNKISYLDFIGCFGLTKSLKYLTFDKELMDDFLLF